MLNGIHIEKAQIAESIGGGSLTNRVVSKRERLRAAVSTWRSAFSKYLTYTHEEFRLAFFDANAVLVTLVDKRLADCCRELESLVRRGCRGQDERERATMIEERALLQVNHPVRAWLRRMFGI